MNNNVSMAALNAMGAPVAGGGIPMMNNGLPAGGGPRAVPVNENQQRSQLNTYIYEYFICNDMFDCARALISSDQPINVIKACPGRRRDANGNPVDGAVAAEDLDDAKDAIDLKRPDDLPAPNLPRECPESCFLYEWWCLFWDMFNAQRGKGESQNVRRYADYTQAQSRFKQEQQQQMLRAMSQGGMMAMRGQPNGMAMGMGMGMGMGMAQNEIARKAMQNSNRNMYVASEPSREIASGPDHRTPQQQMQLLAQQQAKQQHQHQQHQQQQQMQRDGSDMDGSRRPHSPGSAENAPSPSKRPRLEVAPFAPQGMMTNGRGQPQGIPGQQVGAGPGGNVAQNAMLLTNGINPSSLTAQQFQNFPGQAQGPGLNAKSLQQYANNLGQHQQGQMTNKGMPIPNGPQGQGSPMMQGQEGAIAGYYNADMGTNGMRQGMPGNAGSGPGNNHALQDYQMQLMLLEQQNKKRLLMARQEQDNMNIPRDGSGGPGVGPTGQPFQGTSPQGGPRSVNSPNPNEQMKRGTPQMTAAGMPSPLPDGQSRGSPGSMNFMPNNMDPSMAPHFYGKVNGMDAAMIGGVPNGMRPPSSHPAAFNAGQMSQQMMNMQRQQQQQQQQQQANAGQAQGWPAGPNAAPMMQQQPSQQGVPTPQPIGTPQQRAMPPPSAPAVAQAANGRTQTSSPQQPPAPPTPSQTNKANPKGKKDAKPKRNAKKAATTTAAAAAATTGATPAADSTTEAATPTPQTPITPMHPQSFAKGGQQQQSNGQAANASQPAAAAASQAPTLAQAPAEAVQGGGGGFNMDDAFMSNMSMDFANPNLNGDVLQDFDFDSFLHQDGDNADAFAFDASAFMENEVGAE